MTQRAIHIRGIAAFTLASLAVLVWYLSPGQRTFEESERLLLDARLKLSLRQFQEAEATALKFEPRDQQFAAALLVAGEAATRDGRFQDARQHYQRVPRDGSENAVLAARSQGEVCRELGLLSEAISQYRECLSHDSRNISARQRLAYLLQVSGQRWEAREQFVELLKSRQINMEELCLLGDIERPLDEETYLLKCQRVAPNDLHVGLGLAVDQIARGLHAQALPQLNAVASQWSDSLSVQAMRGEALFETHAWSELQAWHAKLQGRPVNHPDIWFVRGLWARHLGRLDVAVRCFAEAVHLVSEHRRANFQLSQVLIAINDSAAPDFVERSRLQFELTHDFDRVLNAKQRQDERVVERIVANLEASGRLLEAQAWANQVASHSPSSEWAVHAMKRLTPQLADQSTLTIASADLVRKHDLLRFPLPDKNFGARDDSSPPGESGSDPGAIRFEELNVGVDFVYEPGSDPATKGVRMFEQTGGGVGVIDFDHDSWPDLFFTQGMHWPTGSERPEFSAKLHDQLFRNVSGQAVDVTQLALPADQGFGQGCSVGDINGDGFADLYVGNVGGNQLLLNNGDGTFSDITAEAGIVGETWTSSCVIADLNGDGAPDLFDVTYVTGPGVYSLICNGRGCSPKGFDGLPDRVWINQGDGRFQPSKHALPVEGSKGLGVVAFRLPSDSRLHLFVANDQVPNFFLKNEIPDEPLDVKFSNNGFVMGLAFNEHGLAMAGMGIAADDVNGDGLIDFLVTNFKDEPNTLYMQDANGLFSDATRRAGLHTPSIPFVSWGTQFLDADLDGDPDLVVVSGHVDDYRDVGGQYHMRPQLFRNNGRGQFDELRAAEVGPYFERSFLGRGLARLDWDQDGRMDFAVSNIGERASLVRNASRGNGRFLTVQLNATTTARDAIGAQVEVQTSRGKWLKQLVAGDGYMASNERCVPFGLEAADVVDVVRVSWPSGRVSVVERVPSDSVLTLVEGATLGSLRRASSDLSIAVRCE